jgi:hypothetical protein
MPDECKIGIEVNPKVVLGKADYSWHQPVSGESALGRGARYSYAERLGPQSCQRNWRAFSGLG